MLMRKSTEVLQSTYKLLMDYLKNIANYHLQEIFLFSFAKTEYYHKKTVPLMCVCDYVKHSIHIISRMGEGGGGRYGKE